MRGEPLSARLDAGLFKNGSLFLERGKGDESVPEPAVKDLGDGRLLEYNLGANLGSFHLSLYETLAGEALRGPDKRARPLSSAIRSDLLEGLDLSGSLLADEAFVANLSFYEICRLMGRKMSTALRRQIDAALKDLAKAKLSWFSQDGRALGAGSLLAYHNVKQRSDGKSVAVAMIPFLQDAAFHGWLCDVDLCEMREFDLSGTAILHAWFSTEIMPGGRKVFDFNSLASDSVIWEKDPRPESFRTRRKRLLNKFLPDLEKAGFRWRLNESRDRIEIKRPKLGVLVEKMFQEREKRDFGVHREQKKKNCKVPASALADALFSDKGGMRRFKLDGGRTLEIKAVPDMDVFHVSLLNAIVSLLLDRRSAEGWQFRTRKVMGLAFEPNRVSMNTAEKTLNLFWNDIAQRMGETCPDDFIEQAKKALADIMFVQMIARGGDDSLLEATNLLSDAASFALGGNSFIAYNPET